MERARRYGKPKKHALRSISSNGGILLPAVYAIITLMLAGVIAGAVAVNLMSDGSHEAINSYINGFFDSFDKNGINLKTAFIDSLYKYIRIIAAIWVSGFFSPGLIIAAGIILFKSFAYGFTTAVLVRYFGFYGFVVGFGGYIPQSFFFLPAMFFVSYNAFMRIFGRITARERHGKQSSSLSEYCFVLLIGILSCVCAALTETYLTPALLEYVRPL